MGMRAIDRRGNLARRDNYANVHTYIVYTTIEESLVTYQRFIEPLLRACVFFSFIAHKYTVCVYVCMHKNRSETEKKKAIVISIPTILFTEFLSFHRSAGVRPRDPYSGDLSSHD